MSDRLVTVAKYGLEYEAGLAKSLLAAEGIEAVIHGDITGSLLGGPTMLGGVIQLQVPADLAPRAAGILAAVAAKATLDDDWETQAEEGAGVWVCSLCGSPVSNQLWTCNSCKTPRDAIQTGRRGTATDLQCAPDSRGTSESVLPQEDLPPALTDPETLSAEEEDEGEKPLLLSEGDQLAQRAFKAAGLTALFWPLVLYSVWLLWRLFFVDEELSPAGLRKFYWAMAIDGLVCLFWLAALAWLTAL